MRATNGVIRALILVAAFCGRAESATVTLNASVTHQEIFGIGAFARIAPWKIKPGLFYEYVSLDSVGYYDTVFADMSVLRTNIPPDMQTEESGPFTPPDLSELRNLHDHGFTRFFAAAWTPPAYMKYNEGISRQSPGDNSIRPEFYDDFGRYVVYYINQFREQVGVELSAVCLSNEPLFDQPYVSCSYTYAEMRDMLSVALPIIAAECPQVRVMLPDDTFFPGRYEKWLGTALANTTVDMHTDIVSVHGYASSTGIGARDADWADLAAQARKAGKELWQTEQSETPGDWDGAMRTAEGMQSALVFGNVRAWLWWSLMETVGGEHVGMWIDSSRGGHGVAITQYGRFVRPGAVRIDASSDDADVRCAAFRTPRDGTVIVLVNTGVASEHVAVAGAAGERFTGIQSTESAWLVTLPAIGETVTLPGRSITTLVSEQPSGIVLRPASALRSAADDRACFWLNGRLFTGARAPAKPLNLRVGATDGPSGVFVSPRTQR